jgi:hypothetical protein
MPSAMAPVCLGRVLRTAAASDLGLAAGFGAEHQASKVLTRIGIALFASPASTEMCRQPASRSASLAALR